MSRNYGVGSRDLLFAFYILIGTFYESYSTIDTNKRRIKRFVVWLKANTNIKRLENVSKEVVLDYANYLKNSGLAIKTIHNYLSVVNVLMELAREDREVWVSAVEDAKFQRKTNITKQYKGICEDEHLALISELPERISCLRSIQRTIGLRFEESCKLDCKKALRQFKKHKQVTILKGTKGGRKRVVTPHEFNYGDVESALTRATRLQGNNKCLIPKEDSYIEFKADCYQKLPKDKPSFHAERHFFANDLYSHLITAEIGHEITTPVLDEEYLQNESGWCRFLSNKFEIDLDLVRRADEKVRLMVSKNLGHARPDITASYIGGR